MGLVRYLAGLNAARIILWCYLIWYLTAVVLYFDPSPSLWLTSVGVSAIVGYALWLSSVHSPAGRIKLGRWQLFRLYLTPFAVSSFAALIKGKGFHSHSVPDAQGERDRARRLRALRRRGAARAAPYLTAAILTERWRSGALCPRPPTFRRGDAHPLPWPTMSR